MIESKKDLKEFMQADKDSLGITNLKRPRLFRDEIWKYEILLRKVEYYTNVKKSFLHKILLLHYKYLFHKLGTKLSFYVRPNVCNKGLSISHVGPVIINDYAKIGENCRIHVGVNIGATLNEPKDAPVIGKNVYIGPGAKIYGKITIGDNVAIGANAVVNKDVPNNVTVAGVPAKIVSKKGNIRSKGEKNEN